MNTRRQWISTLTAALALWSAAGRTQNAPATLANPGFEQGQIGHAPPGWDVPSGVAQDGWTATLSDDQPKSGKTCVLLSCTNAKDGGFGTVKQAIDAMPYRGKRIRLRGYVRMVPSRPDARAQMWLRVDKTNGQDGLFDNMDDRPITSAKPGWQMCSIVGTVNPDAAEISLGVMIIGAGKVYFDDVSLTVLGDGSSGLSAPHPLTERGLQNLTAFTRLLGYVRHFYPGDAAAKTDWNAFAIAGVSVAENAKGAKELAQKLATLFAPVAPTVSVWPTGSARPDLPAALHPPAKRDDVRVVSWKHIGYGFGDMKSAYASERVRSEWPGQTATNASGRPDPGKPFETEIGGGVTCRVPLALFADAAGTLPHTTNMPAGDSDSPTTYSANDRAARLADVALAWNVMQHFYPYFDVVKTDWPAVLSVSLQSAATDTDELAFTQTLRRMVAQLHDGHGGVYGVGGYAYSFPFTWRWIENKLVVTQTLPDATTGLKPGDVVIQIDGKTAEAVLASQEETISAATPQWRRWRAVEEITKGLKDAECTLQIQRGTNAPQTVKAKYTLAADKRYSEHLLEEKRPGDFTEIRPGIFYVDLGKVTKAELDKNLPRLTAAKGLICDLRGYPTGDALQLLPHIATKPFVSAHWNVPIYTAPDRQNVTFQTSQWPAMPPSQPHVGGKIVFLTDGQAISYAESYMGIVEAYKMGEIVGSATAGTNGNINSFTLPGGYHVMWTGMKVTKHDGSQHHSVGIAPTVPAAPTVNGVREGRDEVLEKGVEIISALSEAHKP